MIRILHVDDNDAFVSTTQSLLEATDYELGVQTATTPEDGLAVLSDRSIDCIVSDYEMPGMDGLEFLHRVRSEFGDVPFILFTGEGSESIASEAVSAGVTDYVQKSAGGDVYTLLANRIQAAADKHAAERRASRRSAAIDRASDGIAVVDADHEFIEVNEPYARMHGTTVEQLLGSSHAETLVDRSMDRLESVFESTADEWSGDVVGCDAEGGLFDKHVAVHRVDADTLVLVAQDGDRAGEADQFTRGDDAPTPTELVHSVGDALYAFDEAGRFSFVNRSFCETLAVEPEDVLGEPFAAITADDDIPRAREAFQSIADPETDTTATTYEKQVQTGDGMWVPVETHIARLPGETFRGVAGVVRDVSARQTRVAKLAAQNERLTEVANYISHDLQTPLMTLAACLSRIDTMDTEMLETATETVERMDEMTDGVSRLAQEGWTVETTTELRIDEMVANAWCHVDATAATLDIDGSAERTIEANESKLGHLLENILKNAVDHCDAPTVTVTGRADGFIIADDGPGIPASRRESVFEPGGTADGTGLGLAHAAKIADAHGWDISVTDSPDGGTAVVVRTAPQEPASANSASATTVD